MNGYFENGKPKIDVTVLGLDDKITLPALIDTGFDGALMLSLPSALQIGLRLTNILPVELADGSIKKEFVFEAKVVLDGETLPADVLLTSSDESLIGTALLRNRSVTLDFKHQIITLAPLKTRMTADRG